MLRLDRLKCRGPGLDASLLMTSRKYVGENNDGNLVARGRKTMRENPGPPGGGLGRQLSAHSCKTTLATETRARYSTVLGVRGRDQQNYGGAGLR